MPIESTAYEQQVKEIAKRAASVKQTLLEPFPLDKDGKYTLDGTNAPKILESAIKGTVYEMTPNGAMIAGAHTRALVGWQKQHGTLPPDDLLAACNKATENAILLCGDKIGGPGGIFETASMNTTEGILYRDRLISLVLPVWLATISANMVTFIPGEFNQSEFFRINRAAGSKFGSLKPGDIIDYRYAGVYSAMDQRVPLGTTGKADGTTTDYSFDSKTKFTVVYPFKKKRTRIWVGRKLVAEDNGNGALIGTFKNATGTAVVVSGTVDYSLGKVDAKFSVAPAANLELHLGFDVDIEKDPTLIPRVEHVMDSRVLYPHESAISGSVTIQALWTLRRELGQDIDNMTMASLRNILAADKDRKHLSDMLFHTIHNVDWVREGDKALTLREHYESLNAACLEVDSKLMNLNGVSGMVGIVAGTNATNIFRYLPAPMFIATPQYRSVAQPHYVGRVFGQWDLYCNPQQEDSWSCLCFAKGPDHGQTAYVAGDAVPALSFRHPVLGDLTQKGTMWDLAYRDMQPFDGENYLCKLNFVEA